MKAFTMASLVLLALPARAQLDEGALDRDIIPELVRKLDTPDQDDALNDLVELGPYAKAAAPELLRRLSSSRDNRSTIVMALGIIGANPATTIPALVEVMKDTDPIVASNAFSALSMFGETSSSAVPEMVRMIETGRIYEWAQMEAVSRQGPFARAALPMYRRMIAADDDKSPRRGLSMVLAFSSSDVDAIQEGEREIQRGSVKRRCGLAAAFVHSTSKFTLATLAEITQMAGRQDYPCHELLQGRLPELYRRIAPPPGSHHRVKLRLSMEKTQFYAGEEIKVTPVLADEHDARIIGNGDFFEDHSWPWGALHLILTSKGVRVRHCGAVPGLWTFNVIYNGAPYLPPGGPRRIGRPGSFFIRAPGEYQLEIPETAVHLQYSSGPMVQIFSEPTRLVVLPPSPEFVTQTLRECQDAFAGGDAFEGEAAAERLANLPDPRALPLLVRELDMDRYSNVLKPVLHGLFEYPEPKAVAREIRRLIAEGAPKTPDGLEAFSEILACTDNGWPQMATWCADFPDSSVHQEPSESQIPLWAASINMLGETQRWKLLLKYYQKASK
ncbi:MAG: HEAT repeat domain-containing protein [Elusimicrobia bacterium]|nr:HEAT repeat domain-containing protein [Elusimicrobiota bacterium]